MSRGRPREFDADDVLDKALKVFWERGFQGASLSDLTAATGVARTGLYAAFGDKENMFLAALDRYMSLVYTDSAKKLEDEPDARRAIEAHLLRFVESITSTAAVHSCMLSNTMQESAVLSSKLDARVTENYRQVLGAIQRRLERAQAEGQLPAAENAELLARFLQGQTILISVLARHGAHKDDLAEMVHKAMRAWPN